MTPDYIIATDGSCRNGPGGSQYVGYSYVILNYKTGKYITYGGPLSSYRSIVYAEAWALYQSLRQLNGIITQNRETDEEQPLHPAVNVLVISDSKLIVDSINTWAKHSWDTSNPYHWIKKNDGKEVKNQEVYQGIFNVLHAGNIKLKLVHINSHVEDDDFSIRRFIRSKMKKNSVIVNMNTVETMIKMNSLADNIAQDVTSRKIDRNLPVLIRRRKEETEDCQVRN